MVKKIILAIILSLLFSGCSEHRVDSFPEWCEQITGQDLSKIHRPSWSLIFSISFDGDGIREDYSTFLNNLYLDRANGRAERMAWREGGVLHMINQSSLFVVDPEKMISEWRAGIRSYADDELVDDADICLFGTAATMFDSLNVHSIEPGIPGIPETNKDIVTVIDTGRQQRQGANRL